MLFRFNHRAEWKDLKTSAYCWYNNDSTEKEIYGALYSWYAVNHASGLAYFKRGNIQEVGWRIPTVADIIVLYTLLGGVLVAGGKLKEMGLGHWITPNTGATDEYHWKGLGGGNRFCDTTDDLGFLSRGIYADFWLSDDGGGVAASFYLDNVSTELFPSVWEKYCGMNVRCVKDI